MADLGTLPVVQGELGRAARGITMLPRSFKAVISPTPVRKVGVFRRGGIHRTLLRVAKHYLSWPGGAGPLRVNRGLGVAAKHVALYALSPSYPALTTDTTGKYRAVVTQNSVPLFNCMVLLYWRANHQLIARQRTATDGSFEFKFLIPIPADYFIVVLDPEGGVLQNALVYDRLTPV